MLLHLHLDAVFINEPAVEAVHAGKLSQLLLDIQDEGLRMELPDQVPRARLLDDLVGPALPASDWNAESGTE